MKTIGKKIREARESFGDTQADIAANLGVTKQAVQRWEAGKNKVPFELRPILALELEMPLHELFSKEEQNLCIEVVKSILGEVSDCNELEEEE